MRRLKNEKDVIIEKQEEGIKVGTFLLGFALFSVGIYLVFQNTTISSSFSLSGVVGFEPPFGLVLLPLLVGIGILFFNEKSIIGWLLSIFGIITILLGILMGLRIRFNAVSLYVAILMFGSIAAGIGLIIKAFVNKRR